MDIKATDYYPWLSTVERVVTLSTTPTLIVARNSFRVRLRFQVSDIAGLIPAIGTTARVSTRQGVTATEGFPVIPNQALVFDFPADGDAVLGLWYGIASSGSPNLTIYEVQWRPLQWQNPSEKR